MKIDKSRLKQSTSEVPSECQSLIDKLKACSRVELITELAHVETWTFGKCELYHWISILDVFDGILEEAAASQANKWYLACDTDFAEDEKHLLLSVLHFTTLLIEHSFSRHLYNSMEHLITLLSSSNMQVVLGVLNLLYMFSKRSNFITRLNSEKRQSLLCRLNYLAESWGGKEYGFGLAECCTMKQMSRNASTLYYEYFAPDGNWESIHIKDVHLSPAEYMKNISKGELSEDKMMHVFTRLRLAVGFQKYPARLQFVQARLQALSVLVYSNALQENAHTLLYPGFLEELVELLQLQLPHLVEIRAAALRTLTSIIHLDRNPHFPKKPGSRLSMIIDVTGAGSYHGFLPVLVRTCIGTLTMPKTNDETLFPLPLATALFSFLYHLASYESGGEALVSCGMMESLLRVINWPGNELEHITFVTRAVRVIDLITNIDMQAFQAHGGLNSFVSRLHMEVDLCCREQQLVPLVNIDEIFVGGTVDPITLPIPSTSKESVNLQESTNSPSSKSNRTCLPQRAALLKSMLNFLKKAIQDPAFSDSIRYVMEGTLPTSLKHIISSAEYYGPSLFLLATDVVTVYVFQEPSHLSSLQDNGLTEVVLHALLIKDVPATREVLGSLPNVFSALCLNTRGLLSFIMCKPFDRLFNVLLSPIYLAAMRRRRNSHPMSDTASNLGNAMDELMRHQPSLKGDATTAIIKLLEKLVQLGSDPQYVCWRAQSKVDISLSPAPTTRPTGPNEAGSSDEEDEDEEEVSTSSQNQREDNNQQEAGSQMNERTPIALVDYILNVMKFVDAILSNNSTDDHCKEFVFQGGLVPLLSILGLPNLPVDCPVTAAAQSVASVCKSILNLGHEPLVLQLGLEQLYRVVQSLHPLYNHLKAPGSSVLLGELANAPNVETAFSSATATPLLHAMGAAHGYIVMFVHVCRTGQSEIRTLALQKWGQDTDYGKSLLLSLVHLYTSLVWESTLLLALCSDDIIPPGCDFGKEDLDKLLPPELRDSEGPWSSISTQDCGSNGMTSAMEALSTDSLPPLTMDVDYGIASTSGNDKSKEVASRLASFAHQIKYIKPLLGASSRLGRALAELFGLLVKLCVGSPIRQRRGQVPPTPTLNNPESKEIARVLSYILVDGLAWEKLPPSPIPKFRLTFLICSVGFISPMLFDEKRYAYHLMIHMFVEEGGQASFFDTFRWALSAGGTIPLHEGLEHPNLPDGTGEFLDAWLMLLEKMVNPKSILDSPHVIPFRDRHESGFEPTQYLQQIHRLAFNAIMMMWGKKPLKCYGSRMSETILSIIRHILRGEQIIAERTTATREEAAGGTDIASVGESSSAGAYLSALQTAGPTVNPEHLKQLVDMGFTEEHCSQALRHTTTVEQATEYLLNNPPPLPRVPNSSMDVDLSEDDQMLCAIAMSLGDNGLEINAHNADSSSSKKRKNYYEAPLTEDVMSHFTKGALAACLTLLDTLPDTVYRVCVLLVTIAKRNGDTWRSNMLDSLIREIESHINYLIAIAESGKQPAEIVSELINSTISAKASVTIYLFTLLFEGAKIMDMRIPNTEVVRCAHIVPSLVKLFLLSEKFMTAAGSIPCFPKWMASLLLLINLVEKVNVVAKRRKMFDDVTNPVWGCYDYNGGKWLQYSTQNNKIINNAYDMGEDSCRVVCGRQRYHLSFNDFTQTENESYGIKYIMKLPKSFEVINSRKYNINTNKKSDECTGENSKDAMDVDTEEEDDYMVNNHPTQETVHPLGLSSDMQGVVVTSCVRMMKFPIDRDTMHALMRICLRYTQDHANALLFEIEGGVKILLESAHSTSYTGFVNLATLLIRHVIEEPRTLRYAMEYVLRIRTMPNIPPTYRELFYMSCNQLSAAIARDPVVFQTMASDVLRIDVNSLAKRQDDTRPLVKCIPQTELKAPLMKDFVATRCIYDLLNALVLPSPGNTSAPLGRDNAQYQGDSSSPDEGPIIMTISRPPPRPEPLILPLLGHSHRVRRIVGQPHIDMLRSNHTGNDTSHTETPEDDIPDSNRPFRDSIQSNIKVTEDEPKRPLLPKSVILKILAEAVRSYSTVPQLITDYNYQPGQSPLITEETKALAFILDKMLPIDNAVDRECSSTARMLIAAIASATDVPASQLSVVHEVKLALQRALAMPEGIEKHNQLQMLTGLIPTMLENCPPENPGLLKLHQHNPRKNGIYSIMVRKGLISDLARLPQNLDLSSPNMVATLNATLKPLESLLRISNQPVPVNSKFIKSKTQRRTTEVPGVSLSGVTNSEATHAQGDDMGVEDSESTDHDVSGTGENLEPTSEVDALDDVPHVTGLEEIMDQLLEQDTLESDHSYRPVRSGHVNINRNIGDEQPNIENIGYNPDRDATEDMISSDSGDSNEDSNGSEQDEREMEEDADDNDDEGELENDPYDYDDPLEFYDDEVAHSLFRRDRENEEVLMIHYQDPDNEAEPEGSGRNLVHWHSSNNSSAFSLPFGLLDDQPAAGEGSGVSQNHQLSMTRQNVDPGSVQFSRTHRTNRQRRYQYLHLNSRTSNPPVILQRLLGTAGQNMSMSASPITSGSGFRDSTRVLVMDNGIGIFTNNHEEEQIDFVDQSGYLFGPTLSAALSNTPTALHWWHHEATLLDGDSKFHLGFYLCTKILKDLEKHKGIELAKTRGKRKKRQEEIEPIATPKVFQGTQSTCSDSVRSSAGRGLSRSREFAEITSGFLSSLSNILPAVNADQENLGFDTPLNNTETQSSSSSAVSPQTDETSSVTCTEANSITSSAVPVGDVAPLYQINRPDDDLSENNATVSNNQLSMTGVRESVPLYQMMHRSTTRPVDNSSDSNSLHINQTMNTDSNSEIVETVPPTTLRSVIDLAENNSSGSFKSITVGTETPEFKSLESDLSDPISNNSTLMEQNSSDNYSQSLPPPLFLTNDTNNTLSFSIPDPFVPPRLEINFSSSDEAEEQLNRVRVRRRYAPQTDPPPDEELVLRLNSLESEEQLVLRLESSESDNQLVLHIDSSESEEQLVLRLDSNEPDERLALHIDASESEGRLVLHIDTSESDQTTSCIASASVPVPGIRSYQSNNQMRLIDSDESTVILSPKEATNEYNIESVESAEGYTSVDSPLTVRSPEGLTTAESSESDEQLMCISSFPAPTVSEVQTPQVPSATFPDITISSDESSPVKDHSSARSVSHCPLGGESTQQISQMPIQLEDQPRPSTSRTIDIAIAGSSSGVSDIPEGVDPSFLNALPAEVRAEVIEDHIRQQRREAQCARVQDAPLGLSEVSPEFLAALPPSIQEEVLAQQRMELQRQAAAAANPDDPVDAAAFFQNLQPSLRQAILTDMDESQISSLPPDIAAEAQNLRRDLESRNRQLMHERFLQQNALSSILRTGRGVRGARYAIHSLPQRAGHWAGGPYSRTDGNPSNSANMTTIIANMERLGRPLLDHESLTCLLVLLFIDEPKFNTLRLHRVIRNLCYHVPTRDWVIKSLLSIIEKCNENSDPYPLRSLNSVDRPQWLNISLDAALGCRANVFLMKRVITRRQKSLSPISIHPQAAAVVCKHTLELLISLAKSFPSYFLPLKSNQPKKDVEASTSGSNATKGSKHESEGRPTTDFWEILVKLDTSSGQSRKGKGAIRISKEFGEADGAPKSFETSLFGQLITMLSYNVIRKSSQLTDKLLRLISLISSELHFNPFCAYNANKNKLPVVLEEDCLPESEEHLKLAIQVLTSKSCSEEGLEDATALLLNLSHYSEDTRHLILRLLMDGAISLGVMVKSHIAALMKELKAMRVKTQEKLKDDASSGDSLKALKGVLKDRFTRNAVIVAAPTKMKIACELQLPAMAPLISKTSSQAFFLRILKVICQIRDAIKEAVNKKISLKSGQKASRSNIESNTSSEIAMDISAAECASLSSLELKDYLSVLSDSLDLDVLWDTLSECLLELEETPDHHAVLVLQPAVEAFFLVHSASQSKKRSGDSTNDQVDDAPVQLESEHGSQVTATSETSSEPAVGDHASASNTIPMVSGSPQSVHSIDSFEIAPLSPLESNVENSLDLANTARASSVPSTSLLTYVLVDKHKFLSFAETHRTVLNQILRQTTTHLSDGPFSVLVDHTRVLDFDVKRRYFRTELERLDEGIRREELAVHVRRSNVFEDSFRELYRRNPEEWKNRFYIVFEDEEGQDAGGLLREWYVIISRDIFNPNYALFTVSPGDRVTYMINSSSHCNPNHLCYFKFVGRVIAKAIYDNKLLECYFTRSFYKQILGIQVKHTDMESEDYTFYKSLVYLMEHQVADIGYECTFSTEIQEFGVTEVRDLIPNGRNKPVTEVNKHEYIRLVCQMQMCGAIRQQLNAFLEGFYEIIPKRLISIFNEQELELLISGLPNVDIEDLKANTEYHKYQTNSIQIQWFWRSLRSFDQADRAKFLQFVTGTSKVPLQGFAALEGMNGVQKFQIHRDDRSTDRLPSAHTCFNQLDLPVYETYDKLRSNLLKAIHECSEGFGFA